jgi:hypothetical protein
MGEKHPTSKYFYCTAISAKLFGLLAILPNGNFVNWNFVYWSMYQMVISSNGHFVN